MTNTGKLKGVLSSVAKGFEGHRDAVHNAIDRLDGIHFVGMEQFGARDSTSIDFCLQMARTCDIFVGIVGPRYGSVPSGWDKSFTEIEYEAAFESQKPRLMFLASGYRAFDQFAPEEEGERERLSAFANRVLQDRVVSTFSSASDLAEQVIAALHNHVAPQARAGSMLRATHLSYMHPFRAHRHSCAAMATPKRPATFKCEFSQKALSQ